MKRERRKIINKYKNEFVSEFNSFIKEENIPLSKYVEKISPSFKEWTLEALIKSDPWYMFNSIIEYPVEEFNYWYSIHLKWMKRLNEKYGLTH